MDLQERINLYFSESPAIGQDTLSEVAELIELASVRIVTTLLNDKKILTCGNGSSAICAQMFTSAMLNQFERVRPSLPSIALTVDGLTMMAIANDYDFDDIFSKQVRALGQNGDLLLVYTDGRNAGNLAKAIATAHDKGLSLIVMTGHEKSVMTSMLYESDIQVSVPSNSSPRIQEAHVLITHCLCDLIDHQLFGG